MPPEPESDGIAMEDDPIASVLPGGCSKVIGFGEIGHMLISEIGEDYPNTFKDAKLVKFEPPSRMVPETVKEPQIEIEKEPEDLAEEKETISTRISGIFANIASRMGQQHGPPEEHRESRAPPELVNNAVEEFDAQQTMSQREKEVERLEEYYREILADSNVIYTIASFEDQQDISNCMDLLSFAKESNLLAFTILLLPQSFPRMENVYEANRKLQRVRLLVDLVVVTPNLKSISPSYVALLLKGIGQLIGKAGLVNLDVADIRAIVHGGKVAVIGFGQGSGEERALKAIKRAIRSKLLPLEPHGSDRALVNVTGGADMTVMEAEKVSEEIKKLIKPESRIIWGAMVDPSLEDKIKVTLVIGVTPMQVLMGVYIE